MTGDAGTPLTAKWQIIELDEAQGIGSVEIEDGFTLIPISFLLMKRLIPLAPGAHDVACLPTAGRPG